MACERLDIFVLVVDDDDSSLAIVSNILMSRKYKVITANSAHKALETLQEFKGFFDLVIIELHISGMSGFELQKRVKDEFQLPIIIMSADRRNSVITKSLDNGAELYILKPICADDFKDIWQYARKCKLASETEHLSREEVLSNMNIVIQDVESSAAWSTNTESKRQIKNDKRKDETSNQAEGGARVIKKPRIVWTPFLHNQFLLAINQIGLDRAVPTNILEVMNIPELTRDNVSSHLQKYRIFLRKLSERGRMGLSERDLKSKFCRGLPASIIPDIHTRSEKLHLLKHNYFDPQVSRKNVTNQLERGQSSYSLHKDLIPQTLLGDSLNQVKHGEPSCRSNIGDNIITPNMLISYENPTYQAKSSYKVSPNFPLYGGRNSLMTSANDQIRGLAYCPHGVNYGMENGNMRSFSCSVCLMNDGSQRVGTGSVYNYIHGFGFNNGTQSETMKVAPLDYGNPGFVEKSFDYGNVVLSYNPTSLIIDETRKGNIAEIPQLPQQKDDNVVETEYQYKNADSINEAEVNQIEDDLSKYFSTLEDIYNLDEIEDNSNASKLFISNCQSSCQVAPTLEQAERGADGIVLPAKITSNFPKESPISLNKSFDQAERGGDVIVLPSKITSNFPKDSSTSLNKSPNEMLGESSNKRSANCESIEMVPQVGNVSLPSNSTSEQDWDMELIEALFGATS